MRNLVLGAKLKKSGEVNFWWIGAFGYGVWDLPFIQKVLSFKEIQGSFWGIPFVEKKDHTPKEWTTIVPN